MASSSGNLINVFMGFEEFFSGHCSANKCAACVLSITLLCWSGERDFQAPLLCALACFFGNECVYQINIMSFPSQMLGVPLFFLEKRFFSAFPLFFPCPTQSDLVKIRITSCESILHAFN